MSTIDPVLQETLPFTDPEGIKRYVDQRGGMVVVQMRPVKLAFKVGRLAAGPRAEISRSLGRLSLGHLPVDIPDDQWEWVRLYSLDKPIGRLIDRLVHPAVGDEDDLLAQLSGSDERLVEYMDKLDRIKAIIGSDGAA
jgi:hypothetical protein